MNRIHINENQQRTIKVALSGLDEVLCIAEEWAKGRESKGVFYMEKNDIPLHKRKLIHKKTTEIRKLLAEIKDSLGLEGVQVSASEKIWGLCCGIRDKLSELNSEHMKGYGSLNYQSAQYINDISAKLVNAIDRLVEEIKENKNS